MIRSHPKYSHCRHSTCSKQIRPQQSNCLAPTLVAEFAAEAGASAARADSRHPFRLKVDLHFYARTMRYPRSIKYIIVGNMVPGLPPNVPPSR